MDELSKNGIHQVKSLKGVYVTIHNLLDSAFPKEPRDVFYRFAESYKECFPAWILVEIGLIKGMIFVAPNSKGGTLEQWHRHQSYRHHLRFVVHVPSAVLNLTFVTNPMSK
jgi:hypothetical protein